MQNGTKVRRKGGGRSEDGASDEGIVASINTKVFRIKDEAYKSPHSYEQGNEGRPTTPFIHNTTLCV